MMAQDIHGSFHETAGEIARVEAVARRLAKERGLDPDAISPNAAKAGHFIPEWLFFCREAANAIPSQECRDTRAKARNAA